MPTISNPLNLYWAVRFDFTDEDEDLPASWHSLMDASLVVVSVEDEVPQPDYVFVDVPGKESAIDLSRAVSGKVSTGQGKLTIGLAGIIDDFADVTSVTTALNTVTTVRGNISGRPCGCVLGYWQKSGSTWAMVDSWSPDANAGELFVTEYSVNHGSYEMTLEWVYKVDA